RVSVLEASSKVSGTLNSEYLTPSFQLALETLGGEPITLAPSSIAALVDNLYASVINSLRQMGLIVEQGIVRAQKLIAGILQVNELAVNIVSQTDASGETRDATIGSGQVNVGELDTYIMNNQVSTTTKIFVTPETPVAIGVCETTAENNSPQPPLNLRGGESAASAGEGALTIRPQGFRVCLNATSSQIVKFNWWIIKTVRSAAEVAPALGTPVPTVISAPTPLESPVVSTTPTPTPSVSLEPVASVTPTPTPTPTVTPVATPIPTPTSTPTETPIATPIPTPETTVTPTSIPTPEVTPTPTATP
ncbi:hypothetical protein KJ590_02510, partial [Patescibacteria group bacterium]|nr:hypothetical protein [Patescibacteria group bacterium]